MMKKRGRAERGKTAAGWLESWHTFSFGDYYDSNYMGFGDLRVINDDKVMPTQGFATHSHQDMEIITVVLEGALAHKDSLGNGSIIHPGDVQRMTAGAGVTHSEFNPSENDTVHFLQIWILPEKKGLAPSYEQRRFSEKSGRFRLLASHDGRNGSITVHQDVEIFLLVLNAKETSRYTFNADRRYWIHVASGSFHLDQHLYQAGDGLAVTESRDDLTIEGFEAGSRLLLFNLRP